MESRTEGASGPTEPQGFTICLPRLHLPSLPRLQWPMKDNSLWWQPLTWGNSCRRQTALTALSWRARNALSVNLSILFQTKLYLCRFVGHCIVEAPSLKGLRKKCIFLEMIVASRTIICGASWRLVEGREASWNNMQQFFWRELSQLVADRQAFYIETNIDDFVTKAHQDQSTGSPATHYSIGETMIAVFSWSDSTCTSNSACSSEIVASISVFIPKDSWLCVCVDYDNQTLETVTDLGYLELPCYSALPFPLSASPGYSYWPWPDQTQSCTHSGVPQMQDLRLGSANNQRLHIRAAFSIGLFSQSYVTPHVPLQPIHNWRWPSCKIAQDWNQLNL